MGRHLDTIILLANQAVARCLIGSWSGVPPPALDKSRHNGRRHVDGTHLLNNHYFGSLLVAAGWVKVGGGDELGIGWGLFVASPLSLDLNGSPLCSKLSYLAPLFASYNPERVIRA